MFRRTLFLLLLHMALTISAQEYSQNQLVQDRENSHWAQGQDYVVLLSIDGFRYDYAEKFGARNILKLKESGVSTRKMLPAFPTKTFPNHYTIVTGLYPGNHGLVGNEFYSRSMGSWYKVRDKTAVQNGQWYKGTPLWSLAEQNEMLSASFFWVGSEAEIGGFLPTYTYAYDSRVSNEFRLDQIIDWLNLSATKRPHMILGYFSLVDDAGHRFGPDHEKTKEAVLEIDSLLGIFIQNLDQLDLPVHLVLVSDHGMAAINRGIVLNELTDITGSLVSYSFPPMIYEEDSGKVEQMYHDLLNSGMIDVYKKNNVPGYLHFENDHVGDLILLTKPPLIILDKPQVVYGGTHGFDPFTEDDMGAVFFARGPQLKQGFNISPFENIHIYPFIAKILNLPITNKIDGSVNYLSPYFR